MPNDNYANEPNNSRAEFIIQSILDGTEYDEPAQSRIEYLLKQLKAFIAELVTKGVSLIGETSTALTDNSTTNPIIVDGESYTAQPNDAVIYGHKEFLFDGTKWHEFGDLTGLSSKDIGAMTNYVKAITAADIDSTDTLNQAIGKLEKRVSDNENNISSLTVNGGGVNKATINSSTGTGTMTIPCDPISGQIVVKFAEFTSTDTDANTSVVQFIFTDDTVSGVVAIGRGTNLRATANLAKTVKSIRLFASDNSAHSTGDTFTFSGLELCAFADDGLPYQPYAMSNAEITAWILSPS